MGVPVESFSAVASAWSGEQSEWAGVRKALPGACDSAAHPTVTQIKKAIAVDIKGPLIIFDQGMTNDKGNVDSQTYVTHGVPHLAEFYSEVRTTL